jgi:hypothetical protein
MRNAYLVLADGDAYFCDIDLPGYGGFTSGSECRARVAGDRLISPGPWMLVRIGTKVDHVGSKTNSCGAVYACEVLRTLLASKKIDPYDTEPLFGGGA